MGENWRSLAHLMVGILLLYIGFSAGSHREEQPRYNKYTDAALDAEFSVISNKFALVGSQADTLRKVHLDEQVRLTLIEGKVETHLEHGWHPPMGLDGGTD